MPFVTFITFITFITLETLGKKPRLLPGMALQVPTTDSGRPLTHDQVMEKNGWTPARLFHELGGASGETITKEKLEDKVRAVGGKISGMAQHLRPRAQGTVFQSGSLSSGHNQSYILGVSNLDLYP